MPRFDPAELETWSGGRWDPGPPDEIDGVSNDTRALRPGALYVALRGERHDGHRFVDDAFRRGACAALVEQGCGLQGHAEKPLLLVANTGRALCDAAAGYRIAVGSRIVAVTGSAGKSTVKEMTAQALATTFVTACTLGNWNNDVGLPLSLFAMDRHTELGVFEVGTNHPGEIGALCDVLQPTWGLVTNVGPVHIEFFESVEAIAREKASLLAALPDDGVAFLNADDPFFELCRDASSARVVTISTESEADFAVAERGAAGHGFVVRETSSGEEQAIPMPLPGRHNMANALFAVAVARLQGVPWQAIRDAMAAFRSLPMRWERQDIGGIGIINDAYNANPVSMRAALSTFGEECVKGARWVVLAGMLELGSEETREHEALGRFLATRDWGGVVLVGDLGAVIARGAEDAGFPAGRLHVCRDNAAAAGLLGAALSPGDAVFLKASRRMALESVVAALAAQRGEKHGDIDGQA